MGGAEVFLHPALAADEYGIVFIAVIVFHFGSPASEIGLIHHLLQAVEKVVHVGNLRVQVGDAVGGEVTRVIVEGTHLGGLVQNLLHAGSGGPVGVHLCVGNGGLVGQIVIVTAEQVGFIGQIVIASAEQVRFVGQIVIVAAEEFGLVSQTVVTAIKTSRQFHKAAARQIDGVVADGENLLFGEGRFVGQVVVVTAEQVRFVSQIVIVTAEQIRFVGQIVIVSAEEFGFVSQAVVTPIEAGRQFHKTAARQEDGVIADAQHLFLREGRNGIHRDIAGIVLKCGNSSRHGRDFRCVSQVVVIAGSCYSSEVRFVHNVLRAATILFRPVGGQLRHFATHGRDGVLVRPVRVGHRDDDIGPVLGCRHSRGNAV